MWSHVFVRRLVHSEINFYIRHCLCVFRYLWIKKCIVRNIRKNKDWFHTGNISLIQSFQGRNSGFFLGGERCPTINTICCWHLFYIKTLPGDGPACGLYYHLMVCRTWHNNCIVRVFRVISRGWGMIVVIFL